MSRSHQRTFEVIDKIRGVPGVQAGIVKLEHVLSGPSDHAGSAKRSAANLPDVGSLNPRLPHARWVLVLGLHHPANAPEMDWWEGGNTRGNRRLMDITALMEEWLFGKMGLEARSLPYHVEKGSLFQKDAAAMSGIGIVGRNNLLLHPEWGPRIRFRSMLVSGDLVPTQPLEGFDPCATCDRPCQKACPQRAFARGAYIRSRCRRQMEADESGAVPGLLPDETGRATPIVKYCRECELACPIGRHPKRG